MPTRIPALTLLVAILAVVIHLLPEALATTLQFERSGLAGGQAWRIVTGHLTHFDANHLAWDVAALVALGPLIESTARRALAIALVLASVSIPAAVWMWQPQFETYRGLSGLDSACFGLFATSLVQRRRRGPVVLGLLALVGVSAKGIFEVTTGSTVFATGLGYSPVPLAHLVGVLSGVVAALMARASALSGSAEPRPGRRNSNGSTSPLRSPRPGPGSFIAARTQQFQLPLSILTSRRVSCGAIQRPFRPGHSSESRDPSAGG